MEQVDIESSDLIVVLRGSTKAQVRERCGAVLRANFSIEALRQQNELLICIAARDSDLLIGMNGTIVGRFTALPNCPAVLKHPKTPKVQETCPFAHVD